MRSLTQTIWEGNDASSLPSTPSTAPHFSSITETKHADFASDPTSIEDEQDGGHYDEYDNSDLLTTEEKTALRDSDCYVCMINRYKQETVWKAVAKFERGSSLHGCFTNGAEVNPITSAAESPSKAISPREKAVILLHFLQSEARSSDETVTECGSFGKKKGMKSIRKLWPRLKRYSMRLRKS